MTIELALRGLAMFECDLADEPGLAAVARSDQLKLPGMFVLTLVFSSRTVLDHRAVVEDGHRECVCPISIM